MANVMYSVFTVTGIMQISISPYLSSHDLQTQKYMDSGFLWSYLYRMVFP